MKTEIADASSTTSPHSTGRFPASQLAWHRSRKKTYPQRQSLPRQIATEMRTTKWTKQELCNRTVTIAVLPHFDRNIVPTAFSKQAETFVSVCHSFGQSNAPLFQLVGKETLPSNNEQVGNRRLDRYADGGRVNDQANSSVSFEGDCLPRRTRRAQMSIFELG